MIIFTTCFSRLRFIKDYNALFISIALSSPSWFKGYSWKIFKPTWDILNEYKSSGDKDRYTRRFKKEILDKIDKNALIKLLNSSNKAVYLTCWEETGFCHRQLVANYLKELGFEVKEWRKS